MFLTKFLSFGLKFTNSRFQATILMRNYKKIERVPISQNIIEKAIGEVLLNKNSIHGIPRNLNLQYTIKLETVDNN